MNKQATVLVTIARDPDDATGKPNSPAQILYDTLGCSAEMPSQLYPSELQLAAAIVQVAKRWSEGKSVTIGSFV